MNGPQGEIIRLLTELDALMDTRLGLMDTLDPQSAVRLVSNPDYFTRTEDRFEKLCGFPDAVYQEAWKQRTVDALRHSLISPSVDLVHFSVAEIEHRSLTDPATQGCELDVNTYPYLLTEEEQRGVMEALLLRIGINAPIRLLYEPPSFFTPELIRKRYAGMILYNHNAWLEAQGEKLFAGVMGIPNVTLVAPKLAKDTMPDPAMYDFKAHGVKRDIDPFDASAHVLSQFIHLEFVDVGHFCLAHPGIEKNKT